MLYGVPKGVKVTLDGRHYEVPGLAFWAPNVVLANRAELEALADDTGARSSPVMLPRLSSGRSTPRGSGPVSCTVRSPA